MKKKVILSILLIISLIIPFIVVHNTVKADEWIEIYDITALKNNIKTGTGGNLKLMTDLDANANLFVRSTVNLDLNNKALNMGNYTLVPYNGELTVRDNTDEGNGTIKGSGQVTVQLGTSTVAGTLILESGHIEGTGVYTINNLANSTLTINGGFVENTNDSYGINNQNQMTVNGGLIRGDYTGFVNGKNATINGGTIIGDSDSAIITNTDSTLIINGGLIKTNGYGDGVTLSRPGSSVIMNGGKIEALYERNDKRGGSGITAFKDTEVTINDGEIVSFSFCLAGNGSDSGNNAGQNAKFTINGGTFTSTGCNAMYIPQVNGVTTISGGTFKGADSAIEIRAGSLTITGGTFEGNKDEYIVDPNNNGTNTIGSAISVIQHTTKQPILVTITGGTFNAKVPFSEVNTLGNPAEDVAKIAYDISGGVFNSTGDKTVDVENYDQGKFISGGKYTHWVTDYVQDPYGEKPEDNMIAVYKWRNVTLNKSEGDNATITRKKTISDDGVTIETEDDVTSETSVRALYNDEIVVNEGDSETRVIIGLNAKDAHDNVVASNDAKVNIPDDDVNVFIKYLKLDAEEIDPTKSVDETDMGIESSEETKKEMLKSLKQDNELFNKALNTEDPVLELVVNPIELTEEDKSKVLEKIKDGSEILGQFEIYVVLKDKDGNELGRIYDLTDDIDILLQVPDEIAVSNRRKGAEYNVVRNDSALDLIDSKVENNGNSVAFKTSKLSKYVLAYNLDSETIAPDDALPNTGEDINEGKEKHKSIFDNPTTGDSVAIFIGIFVIAYIAYNKTRKRRVSKLYNRYHGRK